jgi:hypothetical protein
MMRFSAGRAPFSMLVAMLAISCPAFATRPSRAQECAIPVCKVPCCSGGEVGSMVECWQPCWYVQAEVLALRVNELPSDPLALNVGAGATVLTTRDLSYPYQAGPRITMGRTLQSGGSIQATYFGLMEWSSDATVVDVNNLRLPGDLGLAGDDFFGADSITVTQRTQFHSLELNLLQPLNDSSFSWLAGIRYLNFGERLNLHSVDSDGEESDYRTTANNHLIGGQLGGFFDARLDRFTLTALGKAGVYGAIQSATTFVGDFDNTIVLRNLAPNRGGVAFVGEVGLNASYLLTDWLAVRGGYNMYFLAGIARGTDQLDFTDTPASSTTVVNGGAILHGFNGGLEVTW